MGTTRLTNRHQQAPTGTERTAKLVFEIHGLAVDLILTAKPSNLPVHTFACRTLAALVFYLAGFKRGTVFFHKRRSSWRCKPLGLPKCGMATFCASHKLRSFLKSQRSVAPQKLSDWNGFDVEPKNAFELP